MAPKKVTTATPVKHEHRTRATTGSSKPRQAPAVETTAEVKRVVKKPASKKTPAAKKPTPKTKTTTTKTSKAKPAKANTGAKVTKTKAAPKKKKSEPLKVSARYKRIGAAYHVGYLRLLTCANTLTGGQIEGRGGVDWQDWQEGMFCTTVSAV